ncbi:MAG: TspO/MBR family protein [Candidatus Woesearchaeota archaeon]
MQPKHIVKLFLAILICQAAGFVGSIFTTASIPTWYAALQKPWFNPPNWLFFPVWTTLYLLMGIALYLILKKGTNTENVPEALFLFFVQLILNTLWSIIFFGFKAPSAAFLEIIALWIFILLTIVRFYSLEKKAAYLLVPYLLWVSFATVLNLNIAILN